MSKTKAFWAGLISLLLIYASALIWARDTLPTIAPPIIYSIVGLVVGFSGASVANNYQKARWYNTQMEGQ